MKKRYFLVFYEVFSVPANGQVISTKLGPGHTIIITKGKFLNLDEAINRISKGEGGTDDFFRQKTTPLIRNIIELNESDYQEWVR